MRLIWEKEAWEEYQEWLSEDKKTVKRINTLIKSLERNGYDSIGKIEPLKGNLSGYYNARIDEKNRLVFRIFEDDIFIYSCREHYD